MNKVILVNINVRSYVRSAKFNAAQEKINDYIIDNGLDVNSVSLFIKNENEYIFTITLK